MLSESRTQDDSVAYVYFYMEQLISILMRADFMNLMDQRVLYFVINSWQNVENIINNEELSKALNFVYTGNVGRFSCNIPKLWLHCCLEYGFTQKDIICISQIMQMKQFVLRNDRPRYTDKTDDELNVTV